MGLNLSNDTHSSLSTVHLAYILQFYCGFSTFTVLIGVERAEMDGAAETHGTHDYISSESSSGVSDARRKQYQLVTPTLLPNGIEYSICSVPRLIRRDLASVLPGVPVDDVVIVPCCQRSSIDLLNLGADVAAEKDRLLEVFAAWATDVRRRLMSHAATNDAPAGGSGMKTDTAVASSAGGAVLVSPTGDMPGVESPAADVSPRPSHWVDFVDPCSGLPTFTANVTVIYPEVDTMEVGFRLGVLVVHERPLCCPLLL